MSELADYAWLTGAEAADVLDELAGETTPLHRQLDRLRKVLSTARSRLAVEQAALRNKAIPKFGVRASRMFFTNLGLQQATDRWIAQYKTQRFPAGSPYVDLCTGIGGDLLALAERGRAVGWDRAPEVALLAEANLRACELTGELRVGDVSKQTPHASAYWHLDPDRRASGRRSINIAWHSPGPVVVERWLSASPHGAVKLAPATQPPSDWTEQAELEWISRDRECRQLVAWFGELANSPGKHRATVVHASPHDSKPPVVYSYAGNPHTLLSVTDTWGQYVYDVDPAVRAARLTGALAEQLQLAALVPGRGYLTGPRLITHPLVSGFRVQEVLPLRVKLIAQQLRGRGVGRLEIKKRGVDTDPERLRTSLDLRGNNEAILLLTRFGKGDIAVLVERCECPDARG